MKNTKEKIFETAKALFSDKGYAATTTKDIADKAGVSEVTIFRQFENKRKLFDETLKHFFCHQHVNEWFERELVYDLEKDLRKVAQLFEKIYQRNAPLMKMLIRDVIPSDFSKKEMKKDNHIIKKLLIKYFEEMQRQGKVNDDPIMLATFFTMNINGYMMQKYIFEQSDLKPEYFLWVVQKTIQAIKS